MEYLIYVLYSHKYGKYYIGQTNNLSIRLNQHNEEKNKSTKAYRPWVVFYKEKFDNRSDAISFERYLKLLKNKKRIRQYTAGWRSSISGGS